MAKLNEGLSNSKASNIKNERPITQEKVTGFNNAMDAILSKTTYPKKDQPRYANQ